MSSNLHPITGKPRPNPYDIVKDDLAALFALDNKPEVKSANRITYHPAQQEIYDNRKRFNVLDLGRRTGKTKLLCDLLVETATAGFPAGYFAPSYKYLLDGWRDIKAMVEHMPGIKPNETEKRIEFPGGGVIECWSLDNEGAGDGKKTYKAGRGRKYKRVVIDEAALVPALEDVFNYAIRPTLMDLKGDAWIGSTPNGKGAFYRFFQRGTIGSHIYDPSWISWQMPTSANPHIPAEEIEDFRRDYPEHVFKQEILAEFLEDSGQVFRNISACTKPKYNVVDQFNQVLEKGIWQNELTPYHVYVIAWDLAKKEDFSVMGVIDCTTKQLVHMDRSNGVPYLQQIPRLIALADKFQPVEIVVEENGNPALLELLAQTRFRKRGVNPNAPVWNPELTEGMLEEQIMMAEAAYRRMVDASDTPEYHLSPLPVTPFVATNASKEEAIQALVLAFERQDISIPNEGVLLGELEEFGMQKSQAGNFKYSAPVGSHDDTVMMLCEGWYRARRYMSVERLTLREKSMRMLDPALHPDNIKYNPSEMAYTSQSYWMNSYKQQHPEQSGTFMKKVSGFGR